MSAHRQRHPARVVQRFVRRAIASAGLAALLATGCVFSSAPPDDVDFAALTDLRQLDGRYRNHGEGETGAPPVFLSAVLFAAEPALDHAAVEIVELRASDAEALAARAVGAQDVVIAERTLVAGRDFALAEGRLRLSRRSALLGYSPSEQTPDDPLVGPRSESAELGLDRRGDGKYRSRFVGGGLVYLIFPVYIHDTTDIRFPRLSGSP